MADPSAPPLPGAVFSVAEARALGLPPSRLRRKEFAAAGRGLRSVTSLSAGLPDHVRALAPEGGLTVASHATAAVLWGMWLPGRVQDGSLHLTRPLRLSQPRRQGVIGHHASLLQEDVVRVQGLQVTSPAWTWCDLAAVLSLTDLVAAGDSLLRLKDAPPRGGFLARADPLCHVEDLRKMIDRRKGSRGVLSARTAVELLRPGVDSAPESRLRLLLCRAALPEPVVNQWIIGPDGRLLSRPDLQYRRLRIALEYEGEHHLLDPAQWHSDIERDDRLRHMGWVVLRFTKKHLRPENAPATAGKVRRTLVDRGWRPGQPV